MKEKKKVLIVDDDKSQIIAIFQMLNGQFEVIAANSGAEALELVDKGIQPDLIILDILMPEMDGWSTFNKLKAISSISDVPIAFLTSLIGETEEKYASEIGAADFITKPFQKNDLMQRIENILKNNIKNNDIDYYVIN